MRKIEKLTYPNKVAEEAEIAGEYKDAADEFAEIMISEFMELCRIPRPSGHVEKMRKYLVNWGNQNNLDIFVDSSGCVVMDLPASSDGKNIEKIILQGHMDMVAVAAKDYTDYIPEKTPIEPFFDKENNCIHTKWRTTLGADDGHGIATCLALAKLVNDGRFKIKHGPIRFLFTYDEETTLEGCQRLSPGVIDTNYLINLDSIYVGLVITSAAGGFCGELNTKINQTNARENSSLLNLNVWGLTGGHSGQDIDKNRCDVLVMFTRYLNLLTENSIDFNIHFVKSGVLMNSIPAKINASIVVKNDDVEAAQDLWSRVIDDAVESYSDGALLQHSEEICEYQDECVISIDDSLRISRVLQNMEVGVIETFDNGDPKTSNNVGLFNLVDGKLLARFLYRSADSDKLQDVCSKLTWACIKENVDFTIDGIFPALVRRENNPLNDLVLESFEKACNFIGDTLDVHSGLEAGYLMKKNPDLIIATLGCDIVNEHTRKETMYTKSIPAYMASLLYILKNLPKRS